MKVSLCLLFTLLASCSSTPRNPASEEDGHAQVDDNTSGVDDARAGGEAYRADPHAYLTYGKTLIVTMSHNKKIPVIIFQETKIGAYQGKFFALSAQDLGLEQAKEFCEKLNDAIRDRGTIWELIENQQANNLRFKDDFESFVRTDRRIARAFQSDAKQEFLNVWYDYPPAMIKHYPHAVMNYPMKQKPAAPEMRFGRPVEVTAAPVLCTLNKL